MKKQKAPAKNGNWSRQVTETSNALDLEPGVFTWDDPRRIAQSLKESAERSRRRKADPFRSAMFMLNFYINRAGRKLPTKQRAVLRPPKTNYALFSKNRHHSRHHLQFDYCHFPIHKVTAMPDREDDFSDIDVAIEFQNADADTREELKKIFVDEEVLESHAFGGADVMTILTTLSKSTIGRLVEFFAKKAVESPKTTFKIGKNEIAMTGYSREDVEALLASPHFKAAVREVRKK